METLWLKNRSMVSPVAVFLCALTLSGPLQPAAEFLELGLTPSDSEKFLTPPLSNGFFPKGSNGAPKASRSEQLRLFTIPSKMTIGTLNKNSRRPFPPTNLEKSL